MAWALVKDCFQLQKAFQKCYQAMSALTGLYFAKLTIKTTSEMQIEESSKLFFDTVKKKSSIFTFESEPGIRRGLIGGAQITNLLSIISK